MKSISDILNKVNSPHDLKNLELSDLSEIVIQIRNRIISVMSVNPGHLGASLGAVEIAVAIHKTFNTPEDHLVWDVGHQSYAHKIICGRNNDFDDIRKLNGPSGFPSRNESEFDDFGTGHSSTSISAVLGMALADKINNLKTTSIAVIGDGSLTGGMSFEALNHLSISEANVLVIVNDNDMSIDPNLGGLQKHLNNIDSDSNIFTNIGLPYYGPYNGNNLEETLKALEDQKELKGPRVLHLKTQKGFGYNHSESGNATHWHAPGKFQIETGHSLNQSNRFPKTYQAVVGNTLVALAQGGKEIAVITPAMSSGSGLKKFEELFPDRFFDVAIAEQHAVTLAAGMATQNIIPVCVVYSTFLQRGYDQLIHDVALQNLPVIFLIDRAGIVGYDGATHHGAFDLAYLNAIPNLTILAPQNEKELHDALTKSVNTIKGPIAIRYPRGKGLIEKHIPIKTENQTFSEIKIKKGNCNKLCISIGNVGNFVQEAINDIVEEIQPNHIRLQKVKPLPSELLDYDFTFTEEVFIFEDGSTLSGISQLVKNSLIEINSNLSFRIYGYPDRFIKHGSPEELYNQMNLDKESIKDLLKKY